MNEVRKPGSFGRPVLCAAVFALAGAGAAAGQSCIGVPSADGRFRVHAVSEGMGALDLLAGEPGAAGIEGGLRATPEFWLEASGVYERGQPGRNDRRRIAAEAGYSPGSDGVVLCPILRAEYDRDLGSSGEAGAARPAAAQVMIGLALGGETSAASVALVPNAALFTGYRFVEGSRIGVLYFDTGFALGYGQVVLSITNRLALGSRVAASTPMISLGVQF